MLTVLLAFVGLITVSQTAIGLVGITRHYLTSREGQR